MSGTDYGVWWYQTVLLKEVETELSKEGEAVSGAELRYGATRQYAIALMEATKGMMTQLCELLSPYAPATRSPVYRRRLWYKAYGNTRRTWIRSRVPRLRYRLRYPPTPYAIVCTGVPAYARAMPCPGTDIGSDTALLCVCDVRYGPTRLAM
eukprot:535266-Rhodomonas_salina.4